MQKLQTVGRWVLVKIVKSETSEGGKVIIPEQARGKSKHSTIKAEILGIGPDAYTKGEEDCVTEGQFTHGDKVMVYKSLLIQVEDEYFVIKPSGIVGVFKEVEEEKEDE